MRAVSRAMALGRFRPAHAVVLGLAVTVLAVAFGCGPEPSGATKLGRVSPPAPTGSAPSGATGGGSAPADQGVGSGRPRSAGADAPTHEVAPESGKGASPAAADVLLGPGQQAEPPGSAGTEGCVGGTTQTLASGNSAPGSICLRSGSILEVRSKPSGDAPWQPLVSSDSSVVVCTSKVGRDNGRVRGVCTAIGPGTSVVRTSTAGGTPVANWKVTIRVVST